MYNKINYYKYYFSLKFMLKNINENGIVSNRKSSRYVEKLF